MESGEASQQPSGPIVVHTAAMDQDRFPDLDELRTVTLRDSIRVRKEAKHTVIRNRHTGEKHHDSVTLKTLRKNKGEMFGDQEHTITLSSEGEDEIQKLLDFLIAVRGGSVPSTPSNYVVVTVPAESTDGRALQQLLESVSATGKYDILADVLKRAMQDTGLFRVLLERASNDPQLFAEAAAALNLVTYKTAVKDLQNLVNAGCDTSEAQFQELLAENPWMFGSEYSELLDRRKWTRDGQQDFVVRRTTDDYIELIEIKTPLDGRILFNKDTSHGTYYAGAELSKAVGQVENYIEELEADRNTILVKDGEDTCKIRAKVIIGRDNDEQQRRALRRFNGHLHRIEVITFDQLLKIAQNVISYLESALRTTST